MGASTSREDEKGGVGSSQVGGGPLRGGTKFWEQAERQPGWGMGGRSILGHGGTMVAYSAPEPPPAGCGGERMGRKRRGVYGVITNRASLATVPRGMDRGRGRDSTRRAASASIRCSGTGCSGATGGC